MCCAGSDLAECVKIRMDIGDLNTSGNALALPDVLPYLMVRPAYFFFLAFLVAFFAAFFTAFFAGAFFAFS